MSEPTNHDLVVIVGAGPRLGRSIATAFGQRGARVVMLARDADRLAGIARDVSAETGARVDTITADAADEAALREAFGQIRSRHGDPTVLVHNPSIAVEAPPTRTPPDALLDGLRLAAGSLLVSAQEVAPAMRTAGAGTILVTGSGAATTGSTWSATLAAQKAVVRNLAFSLADELDDDGIRVATVTIRGLLGATGFEPDRIAAEYVRLHDLAADGGEQWQREHVWERAR